MGSNRIVGVSITLDDRDGYWNIAVTKEFAPEHGGGTQEFRSRAPQIHRALDLAREMVTVHPTRRTKDAD